MTSKKKSLIIILLFVISFSIFADDTANDMLRAYGSGDYVLARRMAGRISGKPEGKLVLALCMVFDPARQDIKGGLGALEELYKKKSLPDAIWMQAALTYGRVAQLAQGRKELYGDLASDVDTHEVFQSVIERAPKSRAACTALFFDLTGSFSSKNQQKFDLAFEHLEIFCRNFKGKPEYLIQLHLLADQKYIELKKDYSSAVNHLEKAHKLGIANPRDAEIALYRIGRIYDLKLDNIKKASEYYSEFLKKYPESGYAPAVKRFLGELKLAKGKDESGQK